MQNIVPASRIEKGIFEIRGYKVMLDRDLAQLYGVTTGALNQAVQRNKDRFPEDFMFQLNKEEMHVLKEHIRTQETDKMGLRYKSSVFTEQGVAMLSSVLSSPRAIAVNIQIMRIFIRFREVAHENDALWKKVEALEKTYDENFQLIFEAMRKLVASKEDNSQEEIGFKPAL